MCSRKLAVVAALLVSCPVMAAGKLDAICEVVGISDGDTFTAKCPTGQTRVRFQGIDAPESKQPYSNYSRQYLAQLIFRQNVRIVQTKNTKSYDRIVANVYDSAGTDIGLKMISAGLAWHYKAFAKEQSTTDRLKYSNAESQAKKSKLGFWIEPNPIPPWEFRAEKKRVF